MRKHKEYQAVNEAYSAVEQRTNSENVGTLLLPSVPTHPLADISDCDNTENIKQVVKERDDALTQAKVYRDQQSI